MNFDIWLFYVLTIVVMLATPGPSHLLMLSNSATYGFKNSYATACGDLSANALQMLFSALGLGVLIVSYDGALTVIKWAGVTYLIWHAIRTIRHAKTIDLSTPQQDQNALRKTLYLQGFLTSATNPKAIYFFTALFPQFISADGDFAGQFFILSMTYIVVDGLFLCLHGVGGQWIVSRIKPQSTIWVGRMGGGLMLLAALLLGLKSLDGLVK